MSGGLERASRGARERDAEALILSQYAPLCKTLFDIFGQLGSVSRLVPRTGRGRRLSRGAGLCPVALQAQISS
jgi:hypothetical protein